MPIAKTNEEYHNKINSINPEIFVDGFYQNGLSKMKRTCKTTLPVANKIWKYYESTAS